MNKRIDVKWLLGVIAVLGGVACGAAETGEGEPVATTEEHLDMGRFDGWAPVVEPGVITAPPAVLNVDGTLSNIEIYGTGTDSALWYASKASPTAAWQGWFWLGGVLASKPAVTMFRTDRRAVVALASNGRIQIAVTVGGGTGFGPFSSILAGAFVGAPAVAYLAPHLYVVARKADSVIYWTRNDVTLGLNNNNWSAWQAIPGGLLNSEPALTSGLGHITVAARGQDNRIWISGTQSTTWSAWRPVGNDTFQGSPALTYHGGGPLVLAARKSNGLVYVASANPAVGATDGWNPISGLTTPSGPGMAANPNTNASGRLGVAVRRSNGFVSFNLWD